MMGKNTQIFLINRDQPRPAGPTTVHEHRAPTDESIRLFGEMQKKAMDSVTNAFAVESTGVHLTMWSDSMAHAIEARMKVGGHTIKAQARLDNLKSPEQRMVDLAETLGKEIALSALIPMLSHEQFRT